ncbi:MAG: methylmalonyl-CoA epimerase [candidate division WOR-3 bacterium]|jgi:methylmalonyl-CoA/ethylmalonyl-CoA epimerase
MNLNHIGIAVKSIEERLKIWRDVLGFRVETMEDVPDQKVRVAMLDAGTVTIELLEPLDSESPIYRFIEKRGEGLHHLSFSVKNIEKSIEELKAKNFRMIDEVPRKGAHGSKIAFIHPGSTGYVLIELCQGKEDH